jgi:hypothetical protein
MKYHLRCVLDGKHFELWQTPTEVTFMCLITDDGVLYGVLTGKKARAAIARYVEWVKSYEETHKKIVKAHLEELQDALAQARRVKVYAIES